jgi:hypothetical protein
MRQSDYTARTCACGNVVKVNKLGYTIERIKEWFKPGMCGDCITGSPERFRHDNK